MSTTHSSNPRALEAAWRASGHQAAVVLGSGVALLALFADAPVHIASMRGGIAYAATLIATSIGAWFITRSWTPAHPEEGAEGEESEGETEAREADAA